MYHEQPLKRVAVVGTGMVGSTFAYAMTMMGVARELALIDRTPEKAQGEAMDLRHGLPLLEPVSIEAGDYELCAGAQVVVITAGKPQEEGQTRLDLAKQNSEVMRDMVSRILEHNSNPILLVVANPMDVLTKVALRQSGLPANRVFGSGTVLDSSRFRTLLATHCGLDPRNVHARVLGVHGDSEVLVWSQVNLAGMPLSEFCQSCGGGCMQETRERLDKEVPNAAYEVIRRKGATYYAVATALVSIVESVLKDQRSLLTVSTSGDGLPGLDGVCLSLPCVVGANGVERILAPHLEPEERRRLGESGQVLRETLAEVGGLDQVSLPNPLPSPPNRRQSISPFRPGSARPTKKAVPPPMAPGYRRLSTTSPLPAGEPCPARSGAGAEIRPPATAGCTTPMPPTPWGSWQRYSSKELRRAGAY
eukprot:TRINITY_DN11131_c0_g2_i1.p1 TRINITY_DN11131_c0_g2~~TRINITY_DN11131_c0_g2_i1.p1  ORF type:complete len:420 (+),score=51.99 TRINITY_DN11131_c0_g2_i1:1580-2839(+)